MTVTSPPPTLTGLTYVRPLGAGGFSHVLLYQQEMPRRQLAVKVLTGDYSTPEARRLFNTEADVLAKLSTHPSIITIYSAGVTADGHPYLAMEYCPSNVSTQLRQRVLTFEEVLDIGVRMNGALETAHRAGVLHRDIKPFNILLTSLGLPVLADFGIAAGVTPSAHETGHAFSAPWSAPELVSLASTGTVASEIYSLAATLYTLLANRSPFQSQDPLDNTQTSYGVRILRGGVPPIGRADVPPEFEQTLVRAMSMNPAHRFATAEEFGRTLQGLQIARGIPPTALDISSAPAGAADQIEFSDSSSRGTIPVTVNPKGRQLQRAEQLAAAQAKKTPGKLVSPSVQRLQQRRLRVVGAISAALIVAALLTSYFLWWR